MGTNRDGARSMTSGARVLLHYCDVGVTASGENAHPGARASRPQPYWCKQPGIQGHFLAQCTKPAFAGFATLVPSPMRARRPRSRVGRPDGAMEGIRRANSLKADGRLLENSRLSASPAPAVPGGSYESETIGNRPFLRDPGIPSRLTSTP